MSVRDYAVLFLGKRGASSGTRGGNAVLTTGAHALDGPEHTDKDAIASPWGLVAGGRIAPTAGAMPAGELVPQVKTTAGAPTHQASLGTPCWAAVDQLLYVNTDGGTTWAKVGAGADLTVTPGTLSVSGSPTYLLNDGTYNSFPGWDWLQASRNVGDRLLLVWRRGSGHLAGGVYMGLIGTITATAPTWAFSWGDEFEIYSHATYDVRGEDMVSVIDGAVYVSGRHYDGSANREPFILRCNDSAELLGEASSWTYIEVPLASGSVQNYANGRLHRLPSGTYLQCVGWQGSGTHSVGVATSADPLDWDAMVVTTVGSGANDYAEINVEVMADDSTLRAHIRTASGTSHYSSASTVAAPTAWSGPAVLFTAEGWPGFRTLQSGLGLAVYRHSPDGDTAWRQEPNDTDASWGTETILDATGIRSTYASVGAIDRSWALVFYGVEVSSTDGRVAWVVFEDDTVYASGDVSHDALVDVSPDDHHSEDHEARHEAGGADELPVESLPTAETDTTLVLAPDGTGGVRFVSPTGTTSSGTGTSHQHVAQEEHTSDGATTTFTLDNEYNEGSVLARNQTTGHWLSVTEVLPNQATVGAAGTAGDTIAFAYAAEVI